MISSATRRLPPAWLRRHVLTAGLSIKLAMLGSICHGSVILGAAGLSGANVPVSFQAELTISGNSLTVKLTNDSPSPSLNPADTLASFYFDIVDSNNNRPTLTYVSASGDVYLGDKNSADPLQTAGANLKAVAVNDNTWQFKTFNSALTPFLGFGIGTVGNSSLTNSFNGNIVGNIDYVIYKGDVTTSNLDNRPLVKETATFNFTGVSGFTENDIRRSAAFGLGTAPDSLIQAPEPTGIVLGAIGAMMFAWPRRREQI